MNNISFSKQALLDSIIKKLLAQFRFNFEYLGKIESDPVCAYNFLLESKALGAKNLDGSEINLKGDGSDPFGLDRTCHLNSLFAFGHNPKPYTFKDDGYQALNHITLEAFPFLYGIILFDLIDRKESAPLVFGTDFNFYEESLTKQFLINKKYEQGYNLPTYHPLHKNVFTENHFMLMNYHPRVLKLEYRISDFPQELKESIIIINFALTMLFNIVLIESAFFDLFGYKGAGKTFDLADEINSEASDKNRILLLAFLLSSLHPFAYVVCYGIFRDRYAMRNQLTLPSPHGSFYFGTDAERKPFKEALQNAIKELLVYKHRKNLLDNREKDALLWLSNIFGIGYSTNLEMFEKNKHFWNKVDYSPPGVEDPSFLGGATEDSPLWRMWYYWFGAYWSYKDLIKICQNDKSVLYNQQDKRISKEACKLKFMITKESSKIAKNYLLKKMDEPALPGGKRKLYKKIIKKIWDIS